MMAVARRPARRSPVDHRIVRRRWRDIVVSGNRTLKSLPLRDSSLQRPAALIARPRYPSSFNSYDHSGPDGRTLGHRASAQ